MDTRFPKVGVAVLIVKEGKLLLGKRRGSHAAGMWACPGGRLEFGEAIEECAQREVREETGLQVDNVRPAVFTNNIFPEDDEHYVTLFLFAADVSGEPEVREPEKCEAWRWFPVDALPQPLMSDYGEVLRRSAPFS